MASASLSPYQAAVRIVQMLRRQGHTAYLAGGCVRDRLLGIEPQDYDVATSARPDAVRALFRQSRYVGEAFGVVLVRQGKIDTEVATFRTEWGYEDGRRPTHVEYSDAQHDALRRDFTINGLFEDPPETAEAEGAPADSGVEGARVRGRGRIIDYVGGEADLKAGVVRAIGDPHERFGEDYLRLLRAVRFAARLGFALDPATTGAIAKLAPHLSRISRERIGQEVQRMLTGPSPALAIKLLQRLGLDGPTLDEPAGDVLVPTVEALPVAAPYPTVLGAWLLDRHWRPERSASMASAPGVIADSARASRAVVRSLLRFERAGLEKVLETWRVALCLSNQDSDALRGVMALLPKALAWTGLGLAAKKRLLAQPLWPATLPLARALVDNPSVAATLAAIEREAPALVREGVAPPAWIRGQDLLALGLPPGPRFKQLLDQAYDRQLDGRDPTRAQALAWLKTASRPRE